MRTKDRSTTVLLLAVALCVGLAAWRPWSARAPSGGRGISSPLGGPDDLGESAPVLRGSASLESPQPPPRNAAAAVQGERRLGALEVHVTDSSGAAVPEARVRVESLGPGKLPSRAGETGDHGLARFDDVDAGEYVVSVHRQGFSPVASVTQVDDDVARVALTLVRTVVVRGRVLRAGTEEPVQRARVRVTRGGSAAGRTEISVGEKPLVETSSDRDGAFVLEIPAARIVTVQALAPGLAASRLALLSAADEEEVVLHLEPGGRVSGRVLAPDGRPSAGARVFGVPSNRPELLANPRLVLGPNGFTLYSSSDEGGCGGECDGEGPVVLALRAVADAEGRYELDHLPLPTDMCLLAEGVEGSRGGVQSIALSSDRPEAAVDIHLEPRAIVAVRVVDSENTTVTTANVTIEGVRGDDEGLHFLEPRGDGSWSDYTGSDGDAYRFAGLGLGAYTIVTEGPAGDVVRTEVVVTSGGEQDITVQVQRATAIRGVVVDRAGQPIAGALIKWRSVNQETDEAGHFELTGSASADDVLRASSPWHLPRSIEDPDVGTEQRIVLEACPVVTGVLRAPEDSDSLRDLIWFAEHADDFVSWRAAPVASDGKFRIPLQSVDRQAVLLLVPRGAAEMLLGPFHLSAGAEHDVGDVQLDAGRTIEGTVVDEAGRPVAGAQVRAGWPELPDRGGGLFGRGPEATTASNGTFRISRVHRGRLSLRVQHPSHAPAAMDDPVEHDLRIVLEPGSFVEGTLRDSAAQPRPNVTILASPRLTGRAGVHVLARTDEQGRFRLGPLAAGEYVLEVHRDGNPVELGTVVLTRGESIPHDVTLR